MDAALRAATLAATAAADGLAEAGARRGLFAGLVIGLAFGGFVSLAALGLATPGLVFGALVGIGLGSAIGVSIAAKRGGWWRGTMAAMIPCAPAAFLASWFSAPSEMFGVLLVFTLLGMGAGAWVDHSLDDLRLAAREASYRASVAAR